MKNLLLCTAGGLAAGVVIGYVIRSHQPEGPSAQSIRSDAAHSGRSLWDSTQGSTPPSKSAAHAVDLPAPAASVSPSREGTPGGVAPTQPTLTQEKYGAAAAPVAAAAAQLPGLAEPQMRATRMLRQSGDLTMREALSQEQVDPEWGPAKEAAISTVKGRRILPSRGRSNFPTLLRCAVVV